MGAPLALAFAAGLLAAFNPCGFALLPAYLAYFVGVAGEDRSSPLRATGRALVVSGTLTLGFAAVFGAVGAVVTLASAKVSRITPWFTVVIGLALIGLGAAMARGFEPRLSLPRMSRGATRDAGLRAIFLFGVSYATVSLSCTLPPFLAAVATTFHETSFGGGVAAFLLYAAGMGSVLAVLSVAVALAQRQVVTAMKRVLPYVHRASGGLLILAGLYVAWYGTYELILNSGRDISSGPVGAVTDLSGRISRIVGDTGAAAIGIAAAIALLAMLGLPAALSRRPPARPPSHRRHRTTPRSRRRQPETTCGATPPPEPGTGTAMSPSSTSPPSRPLP